MTSAHRPHTATLLLLLLPALQLLLVPPLRSSAATVTHLPGFDGRLPFHLETGYVVVDEEKEVELFYHFIESQKNPKEDPLLFWHSGGPGCSSFNGLVFGIGPLKIRSIEYDGSLPTLVYNPYSWTKAANIIFLDSPVGSGFSFSRNPDGYKTGDISASLQATKFLKKWLIDHPHFLSNPLYIGGDSYAGLVVPVIAHEILKSIDAGDEPLLNLKGYVIGNPKADDKFDGPARISFARGVGIISDEIFKKTVEDCKGDDYSNPRNALCSMDLEVVKKLFSGIDEGNILEPECLLDSPKPKLGYRRRSIEQMYIDLVTPPPVPGLSCRSYTHYLSYYWVNSKEARKALHIKKGTVREWKRCDKHLPYSFDVPSAIKYHLSVTGRGYRALVYSGDRDYVIPFLGTEKWINSLNYPIVDEWRSWSAGGQVAGFTKTYSNNLTFVTVKGAGHIAPEYKPKQCQAMVRRWLSHKPL